MEYGKFILELERLRGDYELLAHDEPDVVGLAQLNAEFSKLAWQLISDIQQSKARPLQPIERGDDGKPRFKVNPIVLHLLDTHPMEDMCSLYLRFCHDPMAQWQFAQLIGYDVSSGGGLSYAPIVQGAEADALADLLPDEDKADDDDDET